MSSSHDSECDRMSDESLMLRFRDGDIDAFNCLYRRYSGLKRYMVLLVSDTQLAEDIFQETWIRIINASDRYEVKAQFKTYFFTIAHRLISDHHRRAATKIGKLSERQLIRDSNNEEDPFNNISMGDDRTTEIQIFLLECLKYLEHALSNLPPEQRESLLLKLETDMTYDGIAQMLNLGKETVKSRIRYALKKLRMSVPEDCYGE